MTLNEIKEHPAYINLRTEQGQMDEDGVIVSVSRQALEETLAMFEKALGKFKPLPIERFEKNAELDLFIVAKFPETEAMDIELYYTP